MTDPEHNQRSSELACPICGKPVAGEARFCSNCGANLIEARPPAPSQAEDTAPRPPESTPTQPAPAVRTSATPTPPHGTPSPFRQQPPAIEEPPIREEDTKPREPVRGEPLPPEPAQLEREYDYGPPGEPPDDDYLYEDEGGAPMLPWRPIVAGTIVAAIILIILALLAGAGVPTPAAPPPPTSTATNTLPPLPTETATPTDTATPTATNEPTTTPTDTLTPTPEYCCVTILEGDTLIPIIGRCGHTQWDVVAPTVVALNDNMTSMDFLPPAGAEICVPWPTPVGGAPPAEEPPPSGEGTGETGANPTPQPVAAAPTETDTLEAGAESSAGAGASATLQATAEPAGEDATAPTATLAAPSPAATPVVLSLSAAGSQSATIEASPTATPTVFMQSYVVQSGDTLISIALNANTDVSMLATLNPQMDWSTCDFSNPGGGPGCNPLLIENQQLAVPAATYTPTLSPTPDGSETPTPTATPMAPALLSPADGETFGPGVAVILRWVPIGVLAPDETYLVHVEDQTTGKILELSTRRNQTTLPPEQAGLEDGQAHTFVWTVVVTRKGEASSILSGAYFEMRTFTWQGE